MKIIVEGAGKHFDPKCVEAFESAIDEVREVCEMFSTATSSDEVKMKVREHVRSAVVKQEKDEDPAVEEPVTEEKQEDPTENDGSETKPEAGTDEKDPGEKEKPD